MSGPLREVTIGPEPLERREILALLARGLGFPPWWGNNLDALFELLVQGVEGPVRIRWRLAPPQPGSDLEDLWHTLQAAAREREDLELRVETGN